VKLSRFVDLEEASPRGSLKQTRKAMNAMSIAIPAQSKLKKSSDEISAAP